MRRAATRAWTPILNMSPIPSGDSGRYAGVDAYSVTCDEEAGEYGAPVFHARLGRVPEFEE